MHGPLENPPKAFNDIIFGTASNLLMKEKRRRKREKRKNEELNGLKRKRNALMNINYYFAHK